MALREELADQGERLFKLRSYLPLALVPLLLLAQTESAWLEDHWGDRVDDVFDWACLGTSLLGLAVRCLVAGIAPRRTSGRNTAKGQVADQLNTTGIYSVVRHPLYLGNFLVFLGICLTPALWWFAALATCFYALYYERIMFAEEEFLRRRFGAAFETWAARTPAFVPSPRLWQPAAMPFSWRTVVKREYLTVLLVATVFALLDYSEDALARGVAAVEWEPDTTLPALVVTAICLVVRWVRKRTRALSLDGR